MDDLRVLIAATDPLARAGLASLLQTEHGIRVIGQAATDETALDAFSHDVALLDLGWELDDTLAPLMDSSLLPLDQPIVVLLPDDEYAPQVAGALGADERRAPYGLLIRNAGPEMLVAALQSVTAGLVSVDPALVASLSDIPRSVPSLDDMPEPLTPREREVLDLLAEGLPNKTIATHLVISEYTVKFHVNSILGKLNAGSRTEAVVRATRLGLITL